MTTDIRIRTNGNYVAEGTITRVTRADPPDGPRTTTESFKVGPGNSVEQQFNVPHGNDVTVEIHERAATPEEVAALADAAKAADSVA